VGGLGSQAAVLARSYGIPAIGVARGITKRIKTGEKILVDGSRGLIYINPDDILLSEYEKHKNEFSQYRERVHKDAHDKAKSKDNVEIYLDLNFFWRRRFK